MKTIQICRDDMNKVRLDDICEVLNGFAFKSENYVSSGIRVIRITNVQKGYIEDTDPVFYPRELIELEKYMLKEGDLLISLTGNVGRVALLKNEFLPAALNQRVACIRLEVDDILIEYVYHFLNSNQFEQKCIESAKGVAQKNMSTEWLKEYKIPICSIKQQKKIVALLNQTQGIIKARKQQLQELDILVNARFVEMFGDPVSNPMGWEKCQLKDCLESIDNGKSFICDNNPRIGTAPAILKLSAVTYGVYNSAENKAIIDSNDFVESAEVHNDDLLFTRKNTPELVGRSAYVSATSEKLMMPDLIFRLNTKKNCHKIFLWKLINHDLFRGQIQNLASGSAKSMSNISKERLGMLVVALPPIELQEQFAAFVIQTEKLKATIQKSLDETQLLFDSLMQEYFG